MLRNTTIVRHLAQGLTLKASYKQEDKVEEIERVYFAKLSDFEQLSSAPHIEEQEQWEYRLFEDDRPIGTLRSRSIDQGDRYELTIKTYRKNGPGSEECNLGSTVEMHDVIAMLADRVLRKVRYVYPVPITWQGEEINLKWEIDAFKLENGSFYPWVKVDLEVPDPAVNAPQFPFRADEIIDTSFGRTLNDDERKVIDTLFDAVKSTR
jgi:CYTH domain-containing protein